MSQKQKLIMDLLDTGAIEIAPADQPFWYTSGLFGPFYINTHYLFGNAEEAGKLLRQLDDASGQPHTLPFIFGRFIADRLEQPGVFRSVCTELANLVRRESDRPSLISGGERRDWFFSLPVAIMLDLPHLYLLKDGTAHLDQMRRSVTEPVSADTLAGQKVVHIADLVTEASSYFRCWLPTLDRLGLHLEQTFCVVDRCGGGREKLSAKGIALHSLCTFDGTVFVRLRQAGRINQAQQEAIDRFLTDADAYVAHFLSQHPQFLTEQIALGGKNRQRAERFLQRGTETRSNG